MDITWKNLHHSELNAVQLYQILALRNHTLFLSAQAHLQDFYGRFGFQPVSDVYPEDNIPHIDMARPARSE